MTVNSKQRIGGHTYSLNVEPLADNSGMTNPDQLWITISSQVPPTVQQTTLLHEVIHIVASQQGLRLSERDVRSLEAGLYQWLRDNKISFAEETFHVHEGT